MIDLELLSKYFGDRICYFDSIDSTSLYAKRLIQNQDYVPYIIMAGEQTNGQGRVGKSFYSPSSSGLYMTFAIPNREIPCDNLTPRVALAVRRAILQIFRVDCGIKWVNDLYYNGKKVCGVLCQQAPPYVLIGIGINVVLPEYTPTDLKERLGAIADVATAEQFTNLVIAIDQKLRELFYLSTDQVLSEYRSHCFHISKMVSIENNGNEFFGTCVGIGDDFSLLIADRTSVNRFTSGVLTLIDESRR